MDTNKTHKQGMIDGIGLYGRVCSRQSNCDECPVGTIRGTGVTCQDFARQFPAKMFSILKEMDEGQLTFFEEYNIRFPNNTLPIEVVAACTCRKAVFEGYLDCSVDPNVDEQACINCWNEPFISDVTVTDDVLKYDTERNAAYNQQPTQNMQQQEMGSMTGDDFDINSLTSLR